MREGKLGCQVCLLYAVCYMTALPLAAALRAPTRWPFEQALYLSALVTSSLAALGLDLWFARRRGFTIGSACRAGGVVLLLIALGADLVRRSPLPSPLTIVAAVTLVGAWVFWGWDRWRRVKARYHHANG